MAGKQDTGGEFQSMAVTWEGQSGRSRPRSSSVELAAKRSAKRSTLSVGDVSTSGPLKRTGIVDLFLLRTLFAILPKSLHPLSHGRAV